MYIFSQEQVFIIFFIIGIIIGILLDVFRAVRKWFKTSDGITLIEDVIFLLLSGYIIIFCILELNSGEIRFFLFIAIFFRFVNISFDNKQFVCYNPLCICKIM